MTAEGQQVAEAWRDTGYARTWARTDPWSEVLPFPRKVATALVRETCRPELVIDVASGPGEFLATFLSAFPTARGVWTDASEAMLELATERLAPFAGRVEFHLADMTDLASADLPTGADVITSSRASHHLGTDALRAFYRDAHDRLTPGGYLINLDHTTYEEPWSERYRGARITVCPGLKAGPSHPHPLPFPTSAAHVDALRAAGFAEIDTAWKAFATCLFVARRSV